MKMLKADEVAELLGCSVRTVWRYRDTGELPKPLKVGQLVRWPMEVIEQWIQERIKASDQVSVLAGEAMADCGDFLEATDNPAHSRQIETLRDYFKQIWETRA
jgi:excisionase family DNA binding protein